MPQIHFHKKPWKNKFVGLTGCYFIPYWKVKQVIQLIKNNVLPIGERFIKKLGFKLLMTCTSLCWPVAHWLLNSFQILKIIGRFTQMFLCKTWVNRLRNFTSTMHIKISLYHKKYSILTYNLGLNEIYDGSILAQNISIEYLKFTSKGLSFIDLHKVFRNNFVLTLNTWTFVNNNLLL